jgi:hypothetical protein
MGLLLHPPKSDDWRWSTDKGALFENDLLRNPYSSVPLSTAFFIPNKQKKIIKSITYKELVH